MSYPRSQGRNQFTSKEDGFLAQYIARYNPDQKGRKGNKLYEDLVHPTNSKRFPWAKNHTWHSWRQRYCDNQAWFNKRIRKLLGEQQQPLPIIAPKKETLVGSQNSSSQRVPFSEEDDQHLIRYLAVENPNPRNRSGESIFMQLEENIEGKWPWSERHPWSSWRQRYRNNKDEFDEAILEYQVRKGIDPDVSTVIKRRVLLPSLKRPRSEDPIQANAGPSRIRDADQRQEKRIKLESISNAGLDGKHGRSQEATLKENGRVDHEHTTFSQPSIAILQHGQREQSGSILETVEVDELEEDDEQEPSPAMSPSAPLASGGDNDQAVDGESDEETNKVSEEEAEAEALLGDQRGESTSEEVSQLVNPPDEELPSRESPPEFEERDSVADSDSYSEKIIPSTPTPSSLHAAKLDDTTPQTRTAEVSPAQAPTPPTSDSQQSLKEIGLGRRTRKLRRKKAQADEDFFESSPERSQLRLPNLLDSLPPPQREPPHLDEGPFNMAFTDAKGFPRISEITGARMPGLGDDHEHSVPETEIPEDWPPNRKPFKSYPVLQDMILNSQDRDEDEESTSSLGENPTRRAHHPFSQPSQLPAPVVVSRHSSPSPTPPSESPDETETHHDFTQASQPPNPPKEERRVRLRTAIGAIFGARPKTEPVQPQRQPTATAKVNPTLRRKSPARDNQILLMKPTASTASSMGERPQLSDKGKGRAIPFPEPVFHNIHETPFTHRHSLGEDKSTSRPPRPILRSRLSLQESSPFPPTGFGPQFSIPPMATFPDTSSAPSSSHPSPSPPTFSGQPISSSDHQVALLLGMKESLRRIAEKHGFQVDVAEKMWAGLRSLEKTNDVLKNMRAAAEEVGGRAIDESVMVEIEEERRKQEEEQQLEKEREEERERLKEEERIKKRKKAKRAHTRRSSGFEYTPFVLDQDDQEDEFPLDGSRAAELKRTMEA